MTKKRQRILEYSNGTLDTGSGGIQVFGAKAMLLFHIILLRNCAYNYDCIIFKIKVRPELPELGKSANPQLRTNEKNCGHVDLRTLAV